MSFYFFNKTLLLVFKQYTNYSLQGFFFNVSELSLASAEAVVLVWLGKTSIYEVRLDKDLKPAAKDFGLRLLRNKDKQMHVKAIASYLIKNGLVEVTCTDLKSISREDVQLKKK